jgi:hypothetical protein
LHFNEKKGGFFLFLLISKKISEIGVRITTQKVIKQNTIFNVCEPKGDEKIASYLVRN